MFVLSIPLSPAAITGIKADLTQNLRSVKSSHRCEAFARGLGAGTYAALLKAGASSKPPTVTASGTAFCKYLSNHGCAVEPLPFYRAIARVAIRGAMEALPRLTVFGVGIGHPRRKEDGKREDPREYYTRLLQEREKLLSDGYVESFLLSLAFLSRVQATKTIRSDAGSYRIKHIAENYSCQYPEGQTLGPDYVPNGVLIVAAIHLGFKFKTYIDDLGYNELNVTFNMSKRSLDDLDCEIRPNGTVADGRRWRASARGNRARFQAEALYLK